MTDAFGIDAGNIVGAYRTASGLRGFLYDGTTWTSLNYPGTTGSYATSIDAGNIVGVYLDASGGDHGYLATPEAVPEPSTLLLLGSGLAGVVIFRKRTEKGVRP